MNHVKSDTADSLNSTSHLEEIGETYFQHMGFALSFSWKMFKTGLCCMIHAFFPQLFKTTGSECIKILHERMVTNRHSLKDTQ